VKTGIVRQLINNFSKVKFKRPFPKFRSYFEITDRRKRHPFIFLFLIKPTRRTNFTNLFCHENLHVSDTSSVHHQEFIHCTLSSGICHTAFEQDQDGTAVPSWSCLKAVYKPVWHIPFLSVQWINSWWWTNKVSETCRVSYQNKFVELVHLVGFIINKFVTMHGQMNVKKIFYVVKNA
jgi:hypothetical protein